MKKGLIFGLALGAASTIALLTQNKQIMKLFKKSNQ